MRKKRYLVKSTLFLQCTYSFLVHEIESNLYLDFKRMLKLLM